MSYIRGLKKFFVSIMCMLIAILPVSYASASSESQELSKEPKPIFEEVVNPESVVEVSVNEYEEIMRLQSSTDEELLSLGWTDEEINDLRSFDYEEEFKNRIRAERLQNIVVGRAYESFSTNDDIDISKDLTPEELYSRSATISLRSGVNRVENNGEDWYFYYEWFWMGNPLVVNTDILGVRGIGSVGGTIALPTIMGDSYTMTGYWSASHTVWEGYKRTNYEKVDLGLAEAKFELLEYVSTPQGLKQHYAKDGYGYVHYNNSTSMERMSLAIQYGHSKIKGNPGIDISATLPPSLGVGFSFTKNVVTEAKVIETYRQDGSIVK